MKAMAAWTVLPLFSAIEHSILYGALVSIAYALVGGLVVFGLSPWLWPRTWAEVERALPIDQFERRRSDITVVLLGLVPLFAIESLGAMTWFMQFPPWFQKVWGMAILMLAMSMVLSVAWGVAVLAWRRSLPVKSTSHGAFPWERGLTGSLTGHRPSLSATMALVVLPMIRGSAQRSGRFFILCLFALLMTVAGMAVWTEYSSWWLATFAVLAQIVLTRLNVLVAADLVPLHEECVNLPIRPSFFVRTRRTAVMTPLFVGQVFLSAAIFLGAIAVRPSVFIAYLLASAVGVLALVMAASTRAAPGAREDPLARVSWWLLILVISVALASEVVA
ncbi:MAG: hypothetical protein WCH44_01315 [Betaproteobacteria bacterium]